MLILLTGIYVGIIWLLIFKLKLLPWNFRTQAGVVVVGLAGLIAVLIGFGMGAPQSSGGVTITSPVMSLGAHSFGRVTKVHASINQPLKAGDPIFEVDKTQYEIARSAAEAGLRQAEYGAKQLRAAWDEAKANVQVLKAELKVLESSIEAAMASVDASEASVAGATANLAASKADVVRAKVDVEIGEVQFARVKDLVAQNVQSQSELDSATREVEGRKAIFERVKAQQEKAEDDLRGSEAALRGAKATLEQTKRSRQSLEAQLARAQAAERRALAAAEIDGEGEHSTIRAARAQLANAQYDLDNCVVRAPTNGYVVALGLTEGNYVRMTQVGTFVSTEDYVATALFSQNTVRFIEPDMPAEIALRTYPGKIFTGVVDSVTYAAGEAQLPATGTIPMLNSLQMPQRYVVRIRLDEFPEDYPVRTAASGVVAVYSNTGKPVHIIRKIVIRMKSLQNWLPF